MIEINLLPSGEKRRSGARRSGGARMPSLPSVPGDPWTVGPVAIAVLLLLGIGFVFWQTGATATELQARIDAEVEDSIRLASTIELLDMSEARRDTIEQKIEVIRDVDARRYVWPHIMDEVSRALPQYTWLTSLQSSASARELPQFTLEGHVGSTQALTRFMRELENSPFLRDVGLVTSEQVTQEGRTFQRFTLEARYRRPEPAFVETVPVVVVE